jgi:hypothetical protein
MEMALWFVAGYAVHALFSNLFKMGLGVAAMKVAEIRALELLANSEEYYYQSQGMLDMAAEASGKEQEIKLTKNLLTLRHRDWQNDTVEMLHKGLASHKSFVKWRTWKEAMQYLTEVKTDERIKRLLIVSDQKEKK